MTLLAPKTTLQNRYQITDMIGKGGMGEVYLAIDQRLGHSVALKRTTVGDDVQLAEAFEREARTLAQLRHNVLPKVSDHFEENGEQFLVMEYIPGDDLAEHLKSNDKPFPMNWILFWADQLLEALTYLHKQDPPIIHRDVKPQNLKLTKDNHIVLLDFGLSKHSIGQTRVTTSGSVVGYTPHYAPMEQIRGTGTNARSDIFALSATLYHLLSNTVPIDALTRADALLAGQPDPLRPLTEVNPEVTQSISDAILKGMELRQENRFGTAREMQKALRRAYNDMQSSMAAETIAFNAGSAGLTESDLKTEVISDIPVPDAAETPPPPSVLSEPAGEPEPPAPDYSNDKTEVIDPASLRESPNAPPELDATVQFTPPAPADAGTTDAALVSVPAEPDPDQVETREDLPVGSEYETREDIYDTREDVPTAVPADDAFETREDAVPDEYRTKEDLDAAAGGETGPVPDATVPFIHVDDTAAAGGETVEPAEFSQTENWDEGFETGVVPAAEAGDFEATAVHSGDDMPVYDEGDHTDEYAAGGETATQDAAAAAAFAGTDEDATAGTAPPPAGKSSTGKYIAILGGLGLVLFVVIGAAAAAGWYYTNGGFGFGGEDEPVAEEAPPAAPEEQPEPEVIVSEETEPPADESPAGETETAGTTDEGEEETTDGEETGTTSTKPSETTASKTTSKPTTRTTKKPTTRTTKPSSGTTAKKPPVKKPPVKQPPPPPPKKKKKDAGVL